MLTFESCLAQIPTVSRPNIMVSLKKKHLFFNIFLHLFPFFGKRGYTGIFKIQGWSIKYLASPPTTAREM